MLAENGVNAKNEAARLLALAAGSLRAGRPADAIVPLQAVSHLRPADAGILHDLGLACLECGRLAEAIKALQRAVAMDRNFADAHLRLGIALEASGALGPALEAYERASRSPGSAADACYRAGNLLDTLCRTAEAIDAFGRAAAAAPGTTLGCIASARALLAGGREPEAERILRITLAREPHNPAALDLLGNTLADAGRFEEARACFLRAIERAPRLAGSFYDVARCCRIERQDFDLIERMRAALPSRVLDPSQRSRVHLALGKAADDLGDYEEAMRQFDAAEKLRNGIVRFDLAAFEARVDRMMRLFTPDAFARAASAGGEDPTPVLIIGMPRSGTTLVEQILSAHPQVAAGGELPFWNERGSGWEQVGGGEPGAELLAASAREYLRVLRALAPARKRVTDKMPFNFQWAGLVHAAFPRATIIRCRRSPIDTALSIHQTHFSHRMTFPTGGAALVGYMRAYERLCTHWRGVLPPERFIEIDYETLVAEPEPVIRRMLVSCGLEWDEACLRPDRNERMVRTASKWQARQPIYRTAVARWRAYEPWLGPLRQLLV
jgi:tetratricopeptide (TPR) repeat protein